MNSDVLFHSLLPIMLPYKHRAGNTTTRPFLFFAIWWPAWKAGQRCAWDIMNRVQQLWTMTVHSYLRKLNMEINRNGIGFSHHRIPMWAVNMKNTQSAILKHIIINVSLAWAGQRTFLMPLFSLSLSELYIDRRFGKGLLFACEKTKRILSLGAGLRNVPLKGPFSEKPVQSFSSNV